MKIPPMVLMAATIASLMTLVTYGLHAAVIMAAWNWHLTALFPALPSISLAQGMAAYVAIFAVTHGGPIKAEEGYAAVAFQRDCLIPTMSLIGLFVLQFF